MPIEGLSSVCLAYRSEKMHGALSFARVAVSSAGLMARAAKSNEKDPTMSNETVVNEVSVRIEQEEAYRFQIAFDRECASLVVDER